MLLGRCLALLVATALIAGCASTTVAPRYTSSNPDVMRVGGERPSNADPHTEDLGSYCLETTERWNEQGRTPDGQTLWAKDTLRRVVSCS